MVDNMINKAPDYIYQPPSGDIYPFRQDDFNNYYHYAQSPISSVLISDAMNSDGELNIAVNWNTSDNTLRVQLKDITIQQTQEMAPLSEWRLGVLIQYYAIESATNNYPLLAISLSKANELDGITKIDYMIPKINGEKLRIIPLLASKTLDSIKYGTNTGNAVDYTGDVILLPSYEYKEIILNVPFSVELSFSSNSTARKSTTGITLQLYMEFQLLQSSSLLIKGTITLVPTYGQTPIDQGVLIGSYTVNANSSVGVYTFPSMFVSKNNISSFNQSNFTHVMVYFQPDDINIAEVATTYIKLS